jgi:hypothetical protein
VDELSLQKISTVSPCKVGCLETVAVKKRQHEMMPLVFNLDPQNNDPYHTLRPVKTPVQQEEREQASLQEAKSRIRPRGTSFDVWASLLPKVKVVQREAVVAALEAGGTVPNSTVPLHKERSEILP